MGRKKYEHRISLPTVVLRSLAGAGMVSVALLAPKMTRVMKQLDRPLIQRKELYERITQAVYRLERAGLVRTSGDRGARKVLLTQKGEIAIEELLLGEYRIPEPAFWDGKWRVVIFDLSEKRRRARNQLRFLLDSAGFIRLQDSVWVYPFPCDEFISLLRAHLRSGVGELRTFVAEALESDKALRRHFDLSD